jgi:predicted kinase
MTKYVLMAGLPGTGKSTLAEALARELNGIVLSKDAVRAAIFPGELTDYTREQDDLCFGMLLDAARYLADHRGTDLIFLDGRTFSRREQIGHAIHAAEEASCAWAILLAICPEKIAEARLVTDSGKHPAANRSAELYREVKARFEPIAYPHLAVDTSQPLEICVREAAAYIGADTYASDRGQVHRER